MKLITVVMPVYNGEQHVAAALQSILRQSVDDLDVVVIDDGSTDRTLEVLRSCGDRRLRILVNPTNMGLIASLNRGFAEAVNSVYVARMDADDLSLPDRFAKQVAFMDAHHEIGICSGGIEWFGGPVTRLWTPPSDHEIIKAWLIFDCAFPHPCTMLRSEVIRRFQLRYDPAYPCAEDYDLWSRCASLTRFYNIPEILLRYRRHTASIGATQGSTQRASGDRIRRRWLTALGIYPTPAEEALHYDIGHTPEGPTEQVERWLERLIESNRRTRLLSDGALRAVLAEVWKDAGQAAASRGLWGGRTLFTSSLTGRLGYSLMDRVPLLTIGLRAALRRRLGSRIRRDMRGE